MQASLPPGLSDADKAKILNDLGSEMDRVILASLLQGTSYTSTNASNPN